MFPMYPRYLIVITIVSIFLLLINIHLEESSGHASRAVPKASSLLGLATDIVMADRMESPDLIRRTPDTSKHRSDNKGKDREGNKQAYKDAVTPKRPPIRKDSEIYPPWWLQSYSQSAVFSRKDEFVGDEPLFPPCLSRRNARVKYLYAMEEPRQYISDAKNPCWYDNSTYPNLNCLPYFYVAGVAKSGTSDLFRRITLHPDVMEGMKKEFHWWDYGRYVEGGNIPLKDYARMVTGDQGSKVVESELSAKGRSDKIFGDRSTSVFRDVHRWRFLEGNRGCHEPRVLIGQHIRHVTPNAKIILSFRHPTYRLYSRFLARIPELKRGSSATFHKMAVKAVRLYKDCFSRWSLRHCAYNETLFENTGVRLVGGMYSIFLEDWLRIFPRDQIHVMRYEDYATDMVKEINKIYAFLNLARLNNTGMRVVLDDVKLKAGILYEKVGPMMPETMDILNDFYEPFMENLAEILQDERFLWRDMEIP